MRSRLVGHVVVLLLAVTALARPLAAAEDVPEISDVTEPVARSRIIAHLEHDLLRLGSPGPLHFCSVVLQYVQPGVRDTSWGVACSIGGVEKQTFFVACDDELVGKFTLTESLSPAREAVKKFIAGNCPPGD